MSVKPGFNISLVFLTKDLIWTSPVSLLMSFFFCFKLNKVYLETSVQFLQVSYKSKISSL